MSEDLNLSQILRHIENRIPYEKIGKIKASRGMVYEASVPRAILGSNVEFVAENGERSMGEVVAIQGANCMVMPYNEISGINSETKIYLKDIVTEIRISANMLGRVIDFQGNPLDNKGPIEGPFEKRSIFGTPINPLDRPPIREALDTGINSINCFITAGKGQRLAIMAGSGVGKSVLMGMIANLQWPIVKFLNRPVSHRDKKVILRVFLLNSLS
jgi:flagellum-specific ATP synthase